MTRRCALILCLVWLAAGAASGCSSVPFLGHKKSQKLYEGQIDPRQVQSATMSFADRYVTAMSDVYDRVQKSTQTPEAKIIAQRWKISAGFGAIGNAVDPNPLVGLMDMTMMVTLTREISEEAWAKELFGAAEIEVIIAALKVQEADIWGVTATFLTTDQEKELRELAARWRKDNPGQRYAGGAKLADFPEAKPSETGGVPLASSVFGLIRLDPFAGLDPAVQEVQESRLAAERMFYYVQHMPIILSWQVDVLYDQMLDAPQVKQLLDNTTKLTENTTQFTGDAGRFADATGKFAATTDRFADTIEHFRRQLPEQQATLVGQLDGVITKQRTAALEQATTQVSSEREATIDQLAATVGVQQDRMTKNLRGVMDDSIDRMYKRLRSLVLIAAGCLLAVLVIYRVVVLLRPGGKVQR